eukprot:scaffold4990_cov387-Prasinococcus_capsulatus_cf.AAC.10
MALFPPPLVPFQTHGGSDATERASQPQPGLDNHVARSAARARRPLAARRAIPPAAQAALSE